MKTAGFILIVVGILMIVIRGFNVPVEKNIIDAGPIQVNKKENKWIGWPTYAGGFITLAGIVLVAANRKK